jgi:hypothetical protein
MNLQTDLFGQPTTAIEPPPDHSATENTAVRTLAMPCGFMNNKNQPCRRLGDRAVMVDGAPLVCRGLSMVHCELDCFRTDAIPVGSYDDDDIRLDEVDR